jgi:hypothetical protein
LVHGLIHIELERFGRERLGDEVWAAATKQASVDGKAWLATASYDDAEITGLVLELASGAGTGPQALLEQFGEALVPTLLDGFGHLVDPEWRTIELIANTERLIHTALRASDESARPPLLRVTLRPPDGLLLHYASERRMCGLAKGIIRGVAGHFGESIAIDEETCMLTGGPSCAIAVTRK